MELYNKIKCPYCNKQLTNKQSSVLRHSFTKRHLENFNFFKKYNIKIKL